MTSIHVNDFPSWLTIMKRKQLLTTWKRHFHVPFCSIICVHLLQHDEHLSVIFSNSPVFLLYFHLIKESNWLNKENEKNWIFNLTILMLNEGFYLNIYILHYVCVWIRNLFKTKYISSLYFIHRLSCGLRCMWKIEVFFIFFSQNAFLGEFYANFSSSMCVCVFVYILHILLRK